MIRINLLPVREIKRRNKAKKELTLAATGVALLVALLVVFGSYKIMTVKGLQSDLADLQNKKKQYDTRLQEIKKLEEEKELLLTRIGVIEQLKNSASLTVHVLDDVAGRTPSDRIWLTDLSQSGNQVQLGGMSLDNQTIAKYMVDLEGSSYMENLVLVKSDMKKYADRDLKAFTITSSITTPELNEQTPATPQ
ncbi:MAG: PilN domain-containing protein [bacterium]|nr:PilN domain-containing protein [bacterium]